MRNAVTGLDIGTSKVCAAIAAIDDDNEAVIRGIGTAPSKGINKGFVSNLDKLVDSVEEAIGAAEEKAGQKVRRVVANISGASVAGRLSEGLAPLSRRGREITKRDIEEVIALTNNLSLSLERDLLYFVPHEFVVDDNDGVENPLGLFAAKLKARLYVITALASQIQNISKAVRYAGCDLSGLLPAAIPLSYGILEEKDLSDGVTLIDIGGGITELSIFKKNAIRFFDTVNVGGMDLTACLSAYLKTSFENAEAIKRKYAGISEEDLKAKKKDIFGAGGAQIVINTSAVNALLKNRFDEISFALKERLSSSGCFENQTPSLVITGGACHMNGLLESFENLFGMPVTPGRVKGISGDPAFLSNPTYSAALSLAKYGLGKIKSPRSRPFSGKSFLIDAFYKLREMIEEYF